MHVNQIASLLLCMTLTSCSQQNSTLIDSEDQPFLLWQSAEAPPATVLIFTRTDCPIANRYAPTVRSIYERYHEHGVRILLVYVDPKETLSSIRRHLDDYQFPCHGVHDPLHELVNLVQATVTPEAVVFDSQRRIAYRGRIDDLYVDFGKVRPEPTTHDLEDALESLLANQPVAVAETKAVGCYISDLN